jgi:hypothetical protein
MCNSHFVYFKHKAAFSLEWGLTPRHCCDIYNGVPLTVSKEIV